jgi:hypothetical protein
MHFSPFPSYLVPLRPKYLPQHPIVKHPQSMFLLDARPGVTPIQINMQNDSAVYFKLRIF